MTENKIFVNESNIDSIDTNKYKYIEFDKFIEIKSEDEPNYDFLVICYFKLPILDKKFDFFYKHYYKTKEDLINIETRIKNTKLKKVLLLHDLHYYMFMEGYYRFFNYCRYLKINNLVSLYSDNFESKIINAYSNTYGFNLFTIPHLIDETIFRPTNISNGHFIPV